MKKKGDFYGAVLLQVFEYTAERNIYYRFRAVFVLPFSRQAAKEL